MQRPAPRGSPYVAATRASQQQRAPIVPRASLAVPHSSSSLRLTAAATCTTQQQSQQEQGELCLLSPYFINCFSFPLVPCACFAWRGGARSLLSASAVCLCVCVSCRAVCSRICICCAGPHHTRYNAHRLFVHNVLVKFACALRRTEHHSIFNAPPPRSTEH